MIIRVSDNEQLARVVPVVMFAVSALYLLFELGLNSSILDALDNPVIASAIDGAGQIVAGVGAAILAARWLLNSKSIRLNGLQFAVAIFSVGAAVWYTQGRVIDYVVNAADATSVKAAQHLALMQSAQLSGVAKLSGVSDEIVSDEVANRAFISLMAFTSWHRPDHIAAVREVSPDIIEYHVRAMIGDKIRAAYDEYKNYVEQQLPAEYKRFIDSRSQTEALLSRTIMHRYQDFMGEYRKMDQCTDKRCRWRYESKINDGLMQAFGRNITINDICNSERVRRLRGAGVDCRGMKASDFDRMIRQVFGLPANSSTKVEFNDFVSSEAAQSVLREQLGVDQNAPVSINMSFDDFMELVGNTSIERELRRQIDEFNTPADRMDGGGRDFVRAIVVLPVALGFSLLFSIANLFALLGTVINRMFVLVGAGVFFAVAGAVSATNGAIAGSAGFVLDIVIQLEKIIYPAGSLFTFIYQ